jgi:hypothetical protein
MCVSKFLLFIIHPQSTSFSHPAILSSCYLSLFQNSLPELTVEAFIERVQNGNRWVRLRHIILDITPLTKTHPGGRAVLDAGTNS